MQPREMLNSRFGELKSGQVKAIDGEEAFPGGKRKSKPSPIA